MRLKAGVLLALAPSLARVLPDVEVVVEEVSGRELCITSASDGVHMAGSRHYTGEALDIRTRYMTLGVQGRLVKALRVVLGSAFDVILEKDHIHLEVR